MNNEKALEALNNVATSLQAECGYSKWFPEWVIMPTPELPAKFNRSHYKEALEILRSALLSPFDEAIKIVEDKIAFINAETFEDYDRIKHYGELLSALKARLPK